MNRRVVLYMLSACTLICISVITSQLSGTDVIVPSLDGFHVNYGMEWCGDWVTLDQITSKGDLKPNTLHSEIPVCPDSPVGQKFRPDATRLFCHPNLQAGKRKPAILSLNLQRRIPQNERPEYSLISPSHMAATVIRQTAPLICQKTTGKYEIIFVLDASYDESLAVLKDVLSSPTCLDSSMIRARVLFQPTAMYETSSDNLGFLLANDPTHFYLEIQADMFLIEKGWNRNMVRPMLQYNDIFSVSGRCGHDYREGEERRYKIGRCGENVARIDPKRKRDTENAFYSVATNNRGPMAWRSESLRELGFLDEVSFYLGDDDHDLNRRALWKGWRAAYKYVDFIAPLNVSGHRNKKIKAKMPDHIKKQEAKYKEFRKLGNCTTSGRTTFPQGRSQRDQEEIDKRELKPWDQSIEEESLPPLPPLDRNLIW